MSVRADGTASCKEAGRRKAEPKLLIPLIVAFTGIAVVLAGLVLLGLNGSSSSAAVSRPRSAARSLISP